MRGHSSASLTNHTLACDRTPNSSQLPITAGAGILCRLGGIVLRWQEFSIDLAGSRPGEPRPVWPRLLRILSLSRVRANWAAQKEPHNVEDEPKAVPRRRVTSSLARPT